MPAAMGIRPTKSDGRLEMPYWSLMKLETVEIAMT